MTWSPPTIDELVSRVADVVKTGGLSPEQAVERLRSVYNTNATAARLLHAAIIVARDLEGAINRLEDLLNDCEKQHDALLDEIADLESRVGAER
jgi:hypothetical protein